MKRKIFLTAAFVVCTMFLTAGFTAKKASAFDLTFNGFTDGLNINIGEDLSIYGNYNGSRSSAISGNVNYVLQPNVGLSMAVCPNETTEVSTGWVYAVNFDATKTWCLYQNGIEWGCGTWSYGTAAAASATSATGE